MISSYQCLDPRFHHRGIAPVIATLLMVAIAVVGGTMIFVFSQGFVSNVQTSGTPVLESITILGYDARDIDALFAHDGFLMAAGTAGNSTLIGKNVDERIAIFIKNDSVQQILFSEVRLGGNLYEYDTSGILPLWNSTSNLSPGEYSVLTDVITVLQEPEITVDPGQSITVLIDLDNNFPIGRDTQFKLITTNGGVFVGTVIMGQLR